MTDEELRDLLSHWRGSRAVFSVLEELVALRARVAKLETELKGANLANEKLNRAYDLAARQNRDAHSVLNTLSMAGRK